MNTFKKIITFMLIFICLFVVFTPFSVDAESDSKNVLDKIRVVMDNNYPPYMFVDSSGNMQRRLVDQYYKYIIFAVIIVIIILILRNIFLKRTVRHKTVELVEMLDKLKVSEEKYRQLLTNLNVGVAVYSPKGEILVYNHQFMSLLGATEEQLKSQMPLKIFIEKFCYDNETKMLFDECPSVKAAASKKPVRDFTMGIKNSQNSCITWVKADAIPELDRNNDLVKIIVTLVDITDRRNVQDALRESENRVSALLKAIPDMLFIFNREGVFVDFENQNTSQLYLLPQEFMGKSINELFSSNISEKFKQSVEYLYQTGETQIIEYTLNMPEGSCDYEARLVLCGEDKVMAMVRDITERKKAEARIYEMSIHDIPTGLYNRNYFEDELVKYQNEGPRNVGVVVCDIDGLKLINDTMGHFVGDDYLRTVADVLRICFGKNAFIARTGGDEFAILVKNTSSEEIQRIKVNVNNLINEANNDNRLIPISISFGYAIANKDDSDLREIFKIADEFMYREKLHHRQSVRSKNIDILMKMLQVRDFITEGHGDRMQELSCRLAASIGIPENEIKDVSLLAQFHDIGKVGISDTILFKPGKLSEEEFKEMKRHTEIGYRIAEASPDIKHISDWIYKHHEWWNGGGYPLGLMGEEIPVQCRILAIVDSYDAMTNDRPYRKAMKKHDAITEIKRCEGVQFDPALVETFIGIVDQD